jgi:hypothetical protein
VPPPIPDVDSDSEIDLEMDYDADDIIELLPTDSPIYEYAPSAIENDTTTDNEILVTQLLLFADGPTLVMYDFRHQESTMEPVRRGMASILVYHTHENFWMLDVLVQF